MDLAILYGMLFWVLFILISLGTVYGVAYLYKRFTGKSLQRNKYAFITLIFIIAIVFVIVGLYVSKKFGIKYEFITVAKIAGVIVWFVIVTGYLVKKFKKK